MLRAAVKGSHLHLHVHTSVTDGGVGHEVYEILMETVIAVIEKVAAQPSSLGIETVQVKVHARLERHLVAIALAMHHRIDAAVLNLELHQAHGVAFAWMDLIEERHLVTMHPLVQLHVGIQIAQVLHGRFDILPGSQCQLIVIYHRRLAQPSHETVDALRAVASREGVDPHRHLEEREPLAVRMLPDIALQRSGRERGRVGADDHLVQQIAVLG